MGNFQQTTGLNYNDTGNFITDPLNMANGRQDPMHFFGGGKQPSQMTTPMPVNPGYSQVYDPSTMSMMDYLKSIMPEYDAGYKKLKSDALNQGQSNWLGMTLASNALGMQDKKEKGALEAAGQTANARDQLAAVGGLSSGARERVAEQGQKNYMTMSQDNARQGALMDMNSRVQDEGNKINQLGQLTGLEETKMKDFEGARATDIQNTQAEKDRLNKYNMDLYGKKMEQWAADRQATATENSGKGGGGK